MAMHSESEPRGEPSTRTRARRPAAVPSVTRACTDTSSVPRPDSTRPNPDEEAMRLMMRIVERVEVARSFAKIAAGIFTVSAARAAQQLRVVADVKMVEVVEREGGLKTHYTRVRRIARAAAAAAVHVATHRPEPAQPDSGPPD